MADICRSQHAFAKDRNESFLASIVEQGRGSIGKVVYEKLFLWRAEYFEVVLFINGIFPGQRFETSALTAFAASFSRSQREVKKAAKTSMPSQRFWRRRFSLAAC